MLDIKRIFKSLLLLALALPLFLSGSFASALSSTDQAPSSSSSLGSCGSSSQNLISNSTDLTNVHAGEVFAKIPYKTNAEPVSIYFQAFGNDDCTSLGSQNVSYGSWTKFGSLDADEVQAGEGIFTAQSVDIIAAPYQAALDILIIPNPNICTPTTECNISYDGYSGYVQPSLISKATDQIAVFVVSPYEHEKVTGVTYYDHDTYLYSTPRLEPFNHDYLSGGLHDVAIVVSLANSQKLYLSKTINMGPDYARVDLLRSILYKSSGTVRLLFYTAAALIVVYIILTVIRIIRKRRTYIIEHGLDQDIGPAEDTKPNDQIHIG